MHRHFLLDRRSPRRSLRSLFAAGAGAGMLVLASVLANAQTPADNQAAPPANGHNVTSKVQSETTIPLPSLAPLVQRVSPAVVTISAKMSESAASDSTSTSDSDEGAPFDQFLRRFFEHRGMPHGLSREVMALGSGFIIDPDGYIVTNHHVAANADTITVILQDNSRHTAKVVGRDDKTDLALLKIDAPSKLPYVTWGDSDQVKVGDWVVAVGNPFGLGGTVTSGIVSALGRNINEGLYDDFIQIDAPINRGNSGGPTFDLSGHVIGINTAIYTPSGGSVGIGFAIPSNTAKMIVAQLREHGKVTRGWLGVSIQSITPAIAKSLGIDPKERKGALVASVMPDSPAAAAGVKPGDVIVSAAGHPIDSVSDLPRVVAAQPVGSQLELGIRRGGKEETLEAKVGKLQEQQQQQAGTAPEAKLADLGLDMVPLDPGLRQRFRVPRDVEGVMIRRVAVDSPLAELGLRPGDVIVSVDQRPVTTPEEAADQLRRSVNDGSVLLLVSRRGVSQFVGLNLRDAPASGSSRPQR